MINDIISKDRLVQETFANYLRDRLGWESVYAYNNEAGRTLFAKLITTSGRIESYQTL